MRVYFSKILLFVTWQLICWKNGLGLFYDFYGHLTRKFWVSDSATAKWAKIWGIALSGCGELSCHFSGLLDSKFLQKPSRAEGKRQSIFPPRKGNSRNSLNENVTSLHTCSFAFAVFLLLSSIFLSHVKRKELKKNEADFSLWLFLWRSHLTRVLTSRCKN